MNNEIEKEGCWTYDNYDVPNFMCAGKSRAGKMIKVGENGIFEFVDAVSGEITPEKLLEIQEGSKYISVDMNEAGTKVAVEFDFTEKDDFLEEIGAASIAVNDGGTPTSDIGVKTLNINNIEWGLFWKDFAFSKTNDTKLSDFITLQQVQGQYVPNITAYLTYTTDSYNQNLFYEEERVERDGQPPIITYGNVKTDKLNVKFKSFTGKRNSQEILSAHPKTNGLDIQYGIVSANGITGLDEYYCVLYVNKVSTNYARITAYVSADTSDRYNIFETVKTNGTWYDWKQIYPVKEQDTGWQMNVITSGKYRRVGNRVDLQVDFYPASPNTTKTVLGTLPIGYRPAGGNMAVSVVSRFDAGTGGVPAFFYIDMYGSGAGQVSINNKSVATTERYDLYISFLTNDAFPS